MDPGGHMTFKERNINVDAASWRCININVTLYKIHVSAGISSYTDDNI